MFMKIAAAVLAAAMVVLVPAIASANGSADETMRESRAYLHSFNLPGHGVAIEGYSPVAYFTQGKPVQGSAEFAVESDGVTYHLASASEKQLFTANPEKYIPQFGGWCAFGMSVQDKFPIDPAAFKIENGKLLLFLRNKNVDARALWNRGNAAEQTKKAAAHWKKVSG